MPSSHFDRQRLDIRPLKERKNKVHIERDHVLPDATPTALNHEASAIIDETAHRLKRARNEGKPRVLAFGAHAIKNGLAPVFASLIEEGWITHLATNGAGIIHDWEFAYQGQSSEDVCEGIAQGQFGLWEETGFYLNLAILLGAYDGLGYGESIGRFVEHQGLEIPRDKELIEVCSLLVGSSPEKAAAAADLLCKVHQFDLNPGWMEVAHPYRKYGLQAAAYRLGIPFTAHPMFGHDIIYCHPMNQGAAIGRTAERDFLTFAKAIEDIDGGVYLSVGSAVMSPMIFEKSFSMAQNLAAQAGRRIEDHFIVVVDLQKSAWDWSDGEPPVDSPAYYLRYCKTFSRMGGLMRYLRLDNRDFLLALRQRLHA